MTFDSDCKFYNIGEKLRAADVEVLDLAATSAILVYPCIGRYDSSYRGDYDDMSTDLEGAILK